MRFLRPPKDIEVELMRLIRDCITLRWAVAWASHGFSLFDLLAKHHKKIQQMTVGIHFYQTHPEFIAFFRTHDSVSTIPFVGGPAVELFNTLIAPPIRKRQQEWMESVAEGLRRLEESQQCLVDDLKDINGAGQNHELNRQSDRRGDRWIT